MACFGAIRIAVVWVLWCTTCTLGWTQDLDPQAAQEVSGARSLVSALEDSLVQDRIPGLSLALIEDGQVVLTVGVGESRSLPAASAMDPSAVAYVGDVSHAITALAAMMLVEKGTLALDQALTASAPELRFSPSNIQADSLSLAHLLEGTSGLRDLTWGQSSRDAAGLPLGLTMARLSPLKFDVAPGRIRSNSQVAQLAAALMVERAAGIAFEDYVRTRVFPVLGMRTAVFGVGGPTVQGHLSDGTVVEGAQPRTGWPVLGLKMSVLDLVQLPRLMIGRGSLDGQVIFSPDSIARMERMDTGPSALANLPGLGGLGQRVSVQERVVFRGGLGQMAGTRAVWAYAPEERIGYALILNGLATSRAVALVEAYLSGRLPPAQPAPLSTDLEPESPDVSGLYVPEVVGAGLRPLAARLMEQRRVDASPTGLIVDGKTYRPWPGGVYGPQNAAQATLASYVQGRSIAMVDGDRTFVRIRSGLDLAPVLWAVVYVLCLCICVVQLPGLGLASLRGTLAVHGGIGLRLLPSLALLAMAGYLAALLWALTLDEPEAVRILGHENSVTLSLFVASIMVPLFGFLSFWRGLTAGYGAGAYDRIQALLAGLVVLSGAHSLQQQDLIGLMTWR